MKLQDQVVSLEIAKRLKELGVKQESLFAWVFQGIESQQCVVQRYGEMCWDICASAFTVAELGEGLPVKIEDTEYTYFLYIQKDREIETNKTFWNVYYKSEKMWLHKTTADTEANARGLMLIYLLENKLLTY